jgi:hypothetical protein
LQTRRPIVAITGNAILKAPPFASGDAGAPCARSLRSRYYAVTPGFLPPRACGRGYAERLTGSVAAAGLWRKKVSRRVDRSMPRLSSV